MKVRVVVEFDADENISADEIEEVVEWTRHTLEESPHDSEFGFPALVIPDPWVYFEEFVSE